jgi:periplasmic mercuric ion binding protein
MKFQRLLLIVIVSAFTLSACKTETKKEPETLISTTPNPQKIAFTISGMTCEIGCAKTIQSKLSKKEGITSAKVIFNDSLGLVEFDANTISAEDITAFVNGIAGGDLYKVINIEKVTSFEDIPK